MLAIKVHVCLSCYDPKIHFRLKIAWTTYCVSLFFSFDEKAHVQPKETF